MPSDPNELAEALGDALFDSVADADALCDWVGAALELAALEPPPEHPVSANPPMTANDAAASAVVFTCFFTATPILDGYSALYRQSRFRRIGDAPGRPNRYAALVRSMWWIFTILLGLALSRSVLTIASVVRWRMQREIKELYLPAILWDAFIFLFAVEVWLSASDIKFGKGQYDILDLATLTLIPIGILALVEFLSYHDDTTEVGDDGHERQVTQEEQFTRVRPAFFILLAVVPLLNTAATIYTSHTLLSINVLLPALVMIGALLGLVFTSTRAQVVLSSCLIALMLAFIVLEYEIFGLLPTLLTS